MSISDITAIIAAGVGILGFFFSVYTFHANRQDRKSSIVAKISNGFLVYEHHFYGQRLGEFSLIPEIANAGEKNIKIVSVAITFGKRSMVLPGGFPGTRSLPFELPPNENATFWIPMKVLATTLQKDEVSSRVKVRACFTDAIGNKYYSKHFKVNIRDFDKN